LQPRILRLGFFEDGDVGIGVFPEQAPDCGIVLTYQLGFCRTAAVIQKHLTEIISILLVADYEIYDDCLVVADGYGLHPGLRFREYRTVDIASGRNVEGRLLARAPAFMPGDNLIRSRRHLG